MSNRKQTQAAQASTNQIMILLSVIAFITLGTIVALVLNESDKPAQDSHAVSAEVVDEAPKIVPSASPIQTAALTAETDAPRIQTVAVKQAKKSKKAFKPKALKLKPLKPVTPVNLDKFRRGQFTVREAAQALDKAVNQGLAKAGEKPTVPITDSDFVRRIYLDTIGRIPNLDEYRAYMNASDNEFKRDILIKDLVNRPTYASHQYNYWVGVLRARTNENNANGTNYLNYIREALNTNMPYDKFVNTMIGSSGSPHAEGNGAVGYYFRDNGMPLDNLSNSMQVFLGTDISCAQCHDDPFKEWSQLDYFQLAAFSSGMNYRGGNKQRLKGNSEYAQEMRYFKQSLSFKKTQTDTQKKILVGRLQRLMSYGLSGGGTGMIRLPHDYAYDDAKPFDVVKARAIFGEQPDVNVDMASVKPYTHNPKSKRKSAPTPGEDINSREQFADWMTSKKNPMFTKAIVNRMWHKIMGSQLVGPLTDLEMEEMGPNPQLTKTLVAVMEGLDYDLKKFETVIFASDAYQRATVREDLDAAKAFLFNGPIMTRLTAEQVWDTVNLLKNDQYDLNYEMQPRQNNDGRLFMALKDKTPLELTMLIPEKLNNWRDFFKYGRDKKITAAADAHYEKMKPLEEANQAKLEAQRLQAIEAKKAKYRAAQEAKRRAAARKAAQRKAAQKKAQQQKENQKKKSKKNNKLAIGESDADLISASPMASSEIQITVSAAPKAKSQTEVMAAVTGKSKKSDASKAKAKNEAKQQINKKYSKKKKAKKPNPYAGMMSMMSSMSSAERKAITGKVHRSSEEASPARIGHFLREFGQGDRLLIDGNNTESSVPQALLLMNGLSESILLNPKSSLNRRVAAEDDKIQVAFEVILSRSPTNEERSKFHGWDSKDVCWVLINSTEFLFRR